MTKFHELAQLGQSIWYDNISRNILDSGEMARLIEDGVRGVTSNPSIFKKAIADTDHYDDAIRELIAEGKSTAEIYEALALEDIRRTADLFRPLYEETDGGDGYVSLEVNPDLAHDAEATVEEARRLFKALDRPNVLIKVPATPEGVNAFSQLISEGININVTLMFSLDHYEAISHAYVRGIERLIARGGDARRVASVASFFLSRIDTAVDNQLEAMGNEELQGTIALANAKMAYRRFQEVFSGPEWDALAEQGAQVQRPLWASTSTKNPNYPDTMYVDNLIGPHTVNTIPTRTVEAFLDHGTAAETVTDNVAASEKHLEKLEAVGVDLDAITEQLQDDGVKAFADSFHNLMDAIDEKKKALQPA